GRKPDAVLHAPGRIEVLGKHTDYGGGRSLLCATEQGIAFAAAARSDRVIRITDAASGESATFPASAEVEPASGHWSNYPMTVARRLARDFPATRLGADVAFVSDLPPAAGVSSSGALVVGFFTALAATNHLEQDPAYERYLNTAERRAGYLGAVENGRAFGPFRADRGVGTEGGSQDQTAILCSRPGKLVQYGWLPVKFEQSIDFPEELIFAIGVSGVHAEKTGPALEQYNALSRITARLLTIWREATGVDDRSLGAALASTPDATDRLAALVRAQGSPDRLLARLQQFHREASEIIPGAVDALVRRDYAALGKWVTESMAEAEAGLENQVDETRLLVRSALDLGAVAGSAFGAGFGGSVWALVRRDDVAAFLEQWERRYSTAFPTRGGSSRFVATAPSPPLIELTP
ncbi:MAG: galactokinase family protein, partial [Gemmatimonadota bacterium]